MKDDKPKLIVIAGPTASGKSSLAVELAMELGGEIISADSMQVYRYMDIGTAKPSVEERKGISHHLIDVVEPDKDFNASIYRSLAEPLLKKISKRDGLCFLVGGTGLYIKTLLGGLLECPPSEPRLRQELNAECDERGSAFLHKRLKMLDPEIAMNIHPNDRTRVIRSLEIIRLTQKTVSVLMRDHGFRDNHFKSLKICLNMDRALLYRRINERSISMFNSGLVEEVKMLIDRGYSHDLKSMRSLGYRHSVDLLNNMCNVETMIKQLQTDTRRYAKRQITWFRNDPEMIWIERDNHKGILKKIKEFIRN